MHISNYNRNVRVLILIWFIFLAILLFGFISCRSLFPVYNPEEEFKETKRYKELLAPEIQINIPNPKFFICPGDFDKILKEQMNSDITPKGKIIA